MKVSYVVEEKEEGMVLREYLLAKGISRQALKKIKAKGKIVCNHVEKTVRYKVQEKDTIDITFPKEISHIEAMHIPFTICYEDAHYLIIDKPQLLPCLPTKRYPSHTLANAIIYYYQQQGIEATIHLVNRLDKETSGLMVVAKHAYAHYLLSQDIKQIIRVYHCLVKGHLQGEGVIKAAIIKRPDSMKREVDTKGKRAITRYKVLCYIGENSLVECQLETGRTHQIRVHMAYLGYPLVGDKVYGEEGESFYLESVKVAFMHPFHKEYIQFYKEDRYLKKSGL